jgi:hypothetical protein
MKKMIIAAAAVLVGFAVNAASVTWTASNIFQPGDTVNKVATGDGLVYLFCAEEFSASQVQALLSSTETSLADKVAALNANSIGSSALTGDGRVSTATEWNKAAGSYTFYGVIFEDSAVAENGMYVVTATSSSYGWDNSADTAVSLGNQKTLTQNAGSWSTVGAVAVPEPTSGLLLLLGMAGLALRRKQA